MIQQSSHQNTQPAHSKVIAKLKKLRSECQNIKTQLNSLKNMTFKAKRKIDIDFRFIRDSLKTAVAHKNKGKQTGNQLDQADKENCMRNANNGGKLGQIQVKLRQQQSIMKLKIRDENMREKQAKKQLRLSERIMLELQEIKLLEQRQNLISKKNLRLNNYYSEHKDRIDPRRTITEENQ